MTISNPPDLISNHNPSIRTQNEPTNPLRPGTYERLHDQDLFEVLSFLRQKGLRSTDTARRYTTEMEKFLVFMDGRPLTEITDWLLMDYQQVLLNPPPDLQLHPAVRFNPLAEETADQYMRVIRSFVEYLSHKHILKYNPAKLVPALGVKAVMARDTVKAFTHEQWDAVNATLDHLPENTPGQRNRAERLRFCIRFGYALALRINELACHYHYHIVHTEDKWQLKVVGKGKRSRTLGLTTVDTIALDALIRYRTHLQLPAYPNQEPLPLLPTIKPVIVKTRGPNKGTFINEAGMSDDNWRDQFKRFLREDVMQHLYGDNKGLKEDIFRKEWKHLTPHSLRHTRITHLVEQGKDLLWIQRFAGHERLDTTSIYFNTRL